VKAARGPAPEKASASKGERTRARIAEAAFALFAEKGYEATSMRDIATRAGCAVGLLYRYFPRRESFALELYREQATAAEARAAKLRGTTLAERLGETLRARVAIARPHREVLRALGGAGLDRHGEVGVLSPGTADIRASTERRLQLVVDGASDKPPAPLDEALVRLLFFVELAVVLALTQDDTRGAKKTLALVDAIERMARSLGPLLPLAGPSLLELDALARTFASAPGR